MRCDAWHPNTYFGKICLPYEFNVWPTNRLNRHHALSPFPNSEKRARVMLSVVLYAHAVIARDKIQLFPPISMLCGAHDFCWCPSHSLCTVRWLLCICTTHITCWTFWWSFVMFFFFKELSQFFVGLFPKVFLISITSNIHFVCALDPWY